jgi:hypothetical protein
LHGFDDVVEGWEVPIVGRQPASELPNPRDWIEFWTVWGQDHFSSRCLITLSRFRLSRNQNRMPRAHGMSLSLANANSAYYFGRPLPIEGFDEQVARQTR